MEKTTLNLLLNFDWALVQIGLLNPFSAVFPSDNFRRVMIRYFVRSMSHVARVKVSDFMPSFVWTLKITMLSKKKIC